MSKPVPGDGYSALMRAIEDNNDDEVSRLLDSGADVNAQDKYGVTALMLALRDYDIENFSLLLDNGADVNAQDKYGVTALMIAVQQDFVEHVLLLLDKGANVNIRDKNGSTALMFIDGKYIASLLLGKGAMINIQASDGRTPLFCAVQNGNLQCVEFLLAEGADPTISNKIGLTPFAAARHLSEDEYEEQMEEILEILTKYNEKKGKDDTEVDHDINTSTKKGSAVSKNKTRATSRAGNCEAAPKSTPAPKPRSAPDSEDPNFQDLRQSSLQLAISFFCFIVFSCKFLKECRGLYR